MTNEAGAWMPTRPRSDRDLDEAIALRAVAEQLPELARTEATLLGCGWSTDVYLIDRRFVARFPRNAEVAGYVDQDFAVLELVAAELGDFIALPRVLHRGRASACFPHDFLICELVEGIGADDPRAPFSDALPQDLGRALTRIHSVPLDAARRAGLSQPAWDPYRGTLRFLHGDFTRGNLMVHPGSGRLTGVIDWGNSAIGDPALDFVGLVHWRGWGFTHAVLRCYEAPIEGDLVERIRRTAQVQALQWLTDTVRRRASPEVHLSWVRNAFSLDGRNVIADLPAT